MVLLFRNIKFSHLIQPSLTWSNLLSPHPISFHLIQPFFTSSNILSPHQTISYLIQPFLTSSNLLSPHPIFSYLIQPSLPLSNLLSPHPTFSNLLLIHQPPWPTLTYTDIPFSLLTLSNLIFTFFPSLPSFQQTICSSFMIKDIVLCRENN